MLKKKKQFKMKKHLTSLMKFDAAVSSILTAENLHRISLKKKKNEEKKGSEVKRKVGKGRKYFKLTGVHKRSPEKMK